jgi:hypothetical protein
MAHSDRAIHLFDGLVVDEVEEKQKAHAVKR